MRAAGIASRSDIENGVEGRFAKKELAVARIFFEIHVNCPVYSLFENFKLHSNPQPNPAMPDHEMEVR